MFRFDIENEVKIESSFRLSFDITRLDTVRFFRLFTGEGDMGNTGRGNTQHRGLKVRILP